MYAPTDNVDTTAASFVPVFGTPHYLPVMEGDGRMWDTIGSNRVYSPTTTGFRVHLRHHDAGQKIDVNLAQQFNWHISWRGVQAF